jgi:hypothetical protein
VQREELLVALLGLILLLEQVPRNPLLRKAILQAMTKDRSSTLKWSKRKRTKVLSQQQFSHT